MGQGYAPIDEAEKFRIEYWSLEEARLQRMPKPLAGRVDAIGIDSWAADYGLLDADGNLLGDPFCYRDDRTAGTEQRVAEVVDGAELYAVTGLQHLPFNTISSCSQSRRSPTPRRCCWSPTCWGSG